MMHVLARGLFAVYRNMLALFIYVGFRTQKVRELELPIAETIGLIPYSSRKPIANIPKLYDVERFPKADRARMRWRRIRMTRPLIGALSLLKLKGIPPIPSGHDEMVRKIYPRPLRWAWPHPPVVPPELARTTDLLAELAVAGPFADYVKRISDEEVDRINTISPRHVDGTAFIISLEELGDHQVKDGLLPIGCTVIFSHDQGADRLATQSIVYQGAVITRADDSWGQVEKVALCSLSTHLTIIKHNVYIHLAYLTVHTAVTIDTLPPDHPVRRLIHHCFQTALIGNYEVSQFQIRGKRSYCCTLFSYDYDEMIAVINTYVDAFDLRTLDPVVHAQMRGVTDPPFDYPFLDNVVSLWDIIWNYVSEYIDNYYPGDYDAEKDAELEDWYEALDERIPGGIEHYAGPLNSDAVKKLCATLIYTSTVTHDNVNNIVWNYTTLLQYIPTVVPEDGSLPRTDVAFDFLTTIIGTWKPFNMIFDGISSVALDAQGKRIMDGFVDALKVRQTEMDTEPFTCHTIYPRKLNFSISN